MFKKLLALLLLMSITSLNAQTCSYYRICPGDTLYNIAIRYGTTVNALCAANPNVNPNNLVIGLVEGFFQHL